jgi:hypothetical protein
MPLSEEEWDEGQDGFIWREHVCDFLKDGYPTAYSIDELIEELFEEIEFDIDDDIIHSILVLFLQLILEQLIGDGLIETKRHEGANYYRFSESGRS